MTKIDTSMPQNLSIAALLSWAVQTIQSSDPTITSAVLDSKILLSHCLERDITYLHTWPEKEPQVCQLKQFKHLVQQRCLGHPVAHLVGYRDFWTLRLNVSNATLIPRPETELLVECALQLDLPQDAKVLDLGTGTGAIALALASEKTAWQVTGVDKSHDAVVLANDNRKLNQLVNAKFVQSDWFSNVTLQKFDLIVSNPPYVEIKSPYLLQGDVRFEPLSALTSGADGLEDIRYIIDNARTYLASSAWLVIEHGFEQREEIISIFESYAYVEVQSLEDFNGLPRVTMAKFLGNDL